MSLETRIIQRPDMRKRHCALLDEDATRSDMWNAPEEQGLPSDMLSLIALGARAVKNVPEVRDALVDDLRARIQAGTYQPDSAAIARKMLGIEEGYAPPVGAD